MKKILFSLLMLCCLTAAWAGDGKGSKDKPYTGEWQAEELIPYLKEGTHLAYDCIIKCSGQVGINLIDDKLNNKTVIVGWASWGVGYAISPENPLPVDYKDYYSLNSSDDRQNHTFIVTDVETDYPMNRIYITGHYSGHYDRGDGSKENPYWGEWSIPELYERLNEGDHIALDCDIKGDGYISVIDVRLNQAIAELWEAWSPGNFISDQTLEGYYKQYGKDNPWENRKRQTFIVTKIDHDNAIIFGYFSGFYTTPDADGFVYVESSKQMEIIIKGNENVQGNAEAKIILTDDIHLSDIDNKTLCHIFTGTLDGAGHTIFGSRDGTRQKRTYLFDYCEGATFKNLTFRNINICNEDDENQGIIASQASKNCVFENITIDNVLLDPEESHVGTIVAQANSCAFRNIKVLNSTLSSTNESPRISDEEARNSGIVVGCAVGCSFNNIETNNCHASSEYWLGTVGSAISCDFNNIEVNNCFFTGESYYAGGVVGATSNSTIENAFVKGTHICVDWFTAGGIAGYAVQSNFTNCQVDDQTCIFGDGGILEDANTGGIVGYSKGSKLFNCINSALVASDSDDTGGIVGYSYRSDLIDNCLNTGIVISIDKDDLDEVFRKYKSKSFGTAITTVNYNGNVYQVQQLDEASKELIDNDDYIGGIIGSTTENTTIKNCINYAPYYSTGDYVGGIVGYITGGWVFNCINAPSAIDGFANEDNHGGIIGLVDKGLSALNYNTPITYCLNLNGQKMIGKAENGYSGSDNYSNSSSHSSIDKPITIDMANSGYLAYLMNQQVNSLNDESLLPWRQDLSGDSKTFPSFDPTLTIVDRDYLISSTPTITTAEQLRAFADKVNNGHNPGVAFLGADISYVDEKVVHNPIGNRAHPFSGMFEGNGHTISGLQYHIYLDTEGVGLFGVVGANTYISNVIVDGTSAVTNANAGAAGIVGLVYFDDVPGDVFIKHCASNANVTANKHAGGILGRIMTEEDGAPNSKVYISDCYSTGIITAKESNSGLLCGYMKDHGVVTNCWSAGQLRTSNSNNAPYSNVNPTDEWEYLAGYNEKITISNCYAVNPGGNIDKWNDLDQHAHQKGVEKIANYKVADGTMAFYLNGHTNDVTKSLVWQQKIGTDAYPEFGNEGVYHTRNVSESSNGYVTLCLPYAVQSDDNIHYYTFSEATNSNGEVQLKFDYVEDLIPAGTPLLFRVRNTGENTFYNADGGLSGWSKDHPISPADATWRFWGSFIDQTFYSPETIYYVSNGAIKNGTRPTIPAYRAYFEGPSINELKSSLGANARVRFVIEDEDGETSSINLVELDGNDNFNENENYNENFRGKTYSLMGTEVGESYRGIVIRNGKKVVYK